MGNSNAKKMAKKDDIAKYYSVKEKLGQGSFAVVKRVVHRATNEAFAVKIIKKSKLNEEELAAIQDEVRIMSTIDHPGCVKLVELYDSPKRLFLVLELLEGGELFDAIVAKGSYSEREAADVVLQVAQAIAYLHSVGVVHRDLKPENLLLDIKPEDATGGRIPKIKITDFGLAKSKNGPDTMSTACGTPGYVAPEVLKNEKYTSAVDMWSLGVILYILLCGFPPFYHESTAALYRQIKRGDYDFPDPYWTDISADAKRVVSALLTVNPKKRMTAKALLTDPWVTGKASGRALGAGHLKRLAVTQARLKLRRGIQMVIALNRFANSLQAGRR